MKKTIKAVMVTVVGFTLIWQAYGQAAPSPAQAQSSAPAKADMQSGQDDTVKRVKIEGEFDLPILDLNKEKIKELAKEERNTPVGVFISAINAYYNPAFVEMSNKKNFKERNNQLRKRSNQLRKYVSIKCYEMVKPALRLWRFKETKDEKWLTTEFSDEELLGGELMSEYSAFNRLENQLKAKTLNIISVEYYDEEQTKARVVMEDVSTMSDGTIKHSPEKYIMIREKGKWKFAGDEKHFHTVVEKTLTNFNGRVREIREQHKKEAEAEQKYQERLKDPEKWEKEHKKEIEEQHKREAELLRKHLEERKKRYQENKKDLNEEQKREIERLIEDMERNLKWYQEHEKK